MTEIEEKRKFLVPISRRILLSLRLENIYNNATRLPVRQHYPTQHQYQYIKFDEVNQQLHTQTFKPLYSIYDNIQLSSSNMTQRSGSTASAASATSATQRPFHDMLPKHGFHIPASLRTRSVSSDASVVMSERRPFEDMVPRRQRKRQLPAARMA